jgi:hypothetical protein
MGITVEELAKQAMTLPTESQAREEALRKVRSALKR